MSDNPLILLVDDEKDFLEIFSTKLKAAGFNIAEASGGEEAISKIKEIKPSLVLLDFNMPQMDGAEVLSKIKADPEIANTKVVFLTSYGEPVPVEELELNDKKFAQEVGAMDYLRKDADLDETVAEVKKILAKYKI